MMVVRAGQKLQHIGPAAIGAGDFALILVDMQENARVTERTTTAIAYDFEGIDLDKFKGRHNWGY
jgi:hypothetical protein